MLTNGLPGQEAGPDGQPVGKVVDAVSRQVQVARHLDLLNS